MGGSIGQVCLPEASWLPPRRRTSRIAFRGLAPSERWAKSDSARGRAGGANAAVVWPERPVARVALSSYGNGLDRGTRISITCQVGRGDTHFPASETSRGPSHSPLGAVSIDRNKRVLRPCRASLSGRTTIAQYGNPLRLENLQATLGITRW